MVEKEINQTVVLAIHKHGKNRVLYIPKNLDKLLPPNSSIVDVEIKRVIG